MSPSGSRSRLRRAAKWTVLALVLLPILVLLGAYAGLHSAAVRRALLGRLAASVRQSLKMELAVGDFALRGWNGVELRKVSLGRPGARPFATIERAVATVDLGSVRSPTVVVRSLTVTAPRIDLAAPFPEIPKTPGPSGFEVRRLTIQQGEIAGAPLDGAAAAWIKSWRTARIEARGSFVAERWDVTVDRAETVVERPGFAPLVLGLTARVAYEDGKPLEIRDARISGDGIRLAAAGRVGFGEKAEVTGRLTLDARDVPAEALHPALKEPLFSDLSLPGTRADLRADLTLGPGQRLDGMAEAVWRRGSRVFTRIAVRSIPGSMGEPVRLAFNGDLLPAAPGARHLTGTVAADRWEDLASQPTGTAAARLRFPDVAAALADLRTLWPRLVPSPPAGMPIQGTLAADLSLAGVLTAPRNNLDANLDATWEPRPGARVHLKAEGQPKTLAGTAHAELENLPLTLFSAFAPGLTGTATGQADLDGKPGAYHVRAATDLAAVAYPPSLEHLDSAHLIAEGVLGLGGAFTGTATVDGAGLAGRGRPSPGGGGAMGEGMGVRSFRLAANGTLALTPLSWKGTAALDGNGLDAPGTAQIPAFHLTTESASLSATFRLDAPKILLPSAPAGLTEVSDLHLDGSADRREVRIASLSGSLPGGRTVAGSGRFTVDPLLTEADLDLHFGRPVDAVRAAAVTASLRQGVLRIEAPKIDSDAGPASFSATVPLGGLRAVPQLSGALAGLPFVPAQGPVVLHLAAPSLDSVPLLAALGLAPRPERMRGGVEADLTLDPAAPAAGHGTVRLDGLNVESPDGRVRAEGPVTLRLEDGRLDVLPVRLRIDGADLQGAGVDVHGRADLATGWRPFTDPASAVVRGVSGEAGGTLDATLLNPYLQGGAASGILSINATASGPLDGLTASARLSGPGASFFWAAPYVTRVQDPEAQLSLRDGRWTLDQGRVALNGGTVDLNGGGDLGGPIGLRAILKDVRYRFDYGLSTLLSGRLSLLVPPKESPERMRLSGRLVVERGVLDRDVNLDREVLDLFLRPAKTPGTEETSLDAMDLDVQVATVDGVRIRNNVADLRASWRPIAITGTAATPLIQGQVDIDPGGLLFAYGQTVRIDRGAFVFTGDPVADPKIDLSTTSSLDDPTIGQLRGQERPLDILAGRSAAEEGTSIGNQQLVAAGLAGYLGERVVSRIGESVGLQHLSVRPLLVFGETDPSARLTVGGDLSRYASFALSVDLRNAQARTYLVDLHGFRELPGFALQGFTTDAGNAGASLQQTLDLGGSKPREDGPRLRRLRLDLPKGGAPKGISRFALRRAIRLEKRDLVPDSAAFDVEVDVAELLRRRGYPDPRVKVDVTPSGGGKVDVAVTVEPGPHVTFAFAGDRPPLGAREGITSLYRTDFYEPAAIEEMKKAAVRVFRSRGYLDPQVDVEAQRERPDDPNASDAPRTVTIRTQAGSRVALAEVEITGVDPESAILAAGRFPSPLARTELAASLPGADRRLLDALQALGYPDARIAGRDLERKGRRLTVRIDAGPRQTLGAITITGVDGEEQKRLATLLPLQPGEPARVDRASAGSLLLGRSLATEGYPDATVRTVFRPADPAQPRVRDLVYEVTPGPRVRVARVGFSGERWTHQGLLARVAGLEPGAPFAAGAVEEARSRLLATGVFSKVTAEVDRTEGEAKVAFSLTERPRFHLGYGLRSESGGATSGVLDFLDANFLGRAMTLGLRALYQPDDRSGRLYLQTGGLLGSPVSVEGYVESRRRNAGGGLLEDSREAALQIARPFGAAFTGRLYLRYRSSHLFEEIPEPFFPFDIRIDRPYLGLQALYDSRDDRIAPRSGLFASADLSGSGRFVGSDFSYARLFGQVNLYRQASLAGRPFTWAQSVRAGLARAFAGQELLRDERFFAGGAFSVRGYETESLGPRETLGSLVRPLGGEALFILNEELRFPLPYDLTGLLFADAGQVWKAKDLNADLSTSLGFGLRARTPVGLLRLDVGFPLDRKVQSRSYKLYVGFGNAF